MKKLLITGAGGYIGSVASYLFLQKGYEVVAIDNFLTGYRAPLIFLQKKFGKKQFRFYEEDIKNDFSSILIKEKGISAVVHYAASCFVDESMREPEKYFSNNVCGSVNLLKTILAHKINKIVFSSTCAVYGEATYIPVDEKHTTNPTNPYGESKLMIEKIMKWMRKSKNLQYLILRYFNVCGASDDGSIGDSKKPSTLLVQNAVRGAFGIAPFTLTCPQVNTPDKTPIRDYVNVVDLNEAHLQGVEYLLNGGKSEIINLGTGKGNSVLEIVTAVQQVTGKKFAIEKTMPRQGEYEKMISSIEKARRVLGWEPKRGINESIHSLVKWYKNHPNGWEERNNIV